jgi:alkylation response protein AidB-like acyl-CoA dehydrogenase
MDEVPTLEAFRSEARAWLEANAELRQVEDTVWGVGSDSVAVFQDRDEEEEAAGVARACQWHRRKLADGWALFGWAPRYGGRGLPATYERAFAAEEADFDVPVVPEPLIITLSLVPPTIERFGTTEQKERFLPAFLSTDLLCCQLFSEPNAGSDLASLSCRAERSGDTWRVNGQKVWTSGALQCDYGFLLARSDPTVPKHHGITAFLVPLDRPGVEIRPIRQMTGGATFNEVFLSDVQLGDDLRIGDEGDGWHVGLTILGFERSISGEGSGGLGGSWDQVAALAEHLGATADPILRQRLSALYTRARVLDLLNARTRGRLAAGEQPGAEASLAKIFWSRTLTATSEVVAALLGPRLVADTGEWGTYAWSEHVLGAPGYRIAGGSDEIQLNIVGERVLGLPREPLTR